MLVLRRGDGTGYILRGGRTRSGTGIAPPGPDATHTPAAMGTYPINFTAVRSGTRTEEKVGPSLPSSPTYNHLTPALRSGSMVQQDHVHIISAGGNIHTAYPAIFRTLPSITRTYVLAESAVYELSRDPETEKKRAATRKAASAVKEISATLSIPFSRELVFPPVYASARDILIRIHREVPVARFTFDLSGGAKPLCMALFAFAPWVGGEVYSTFDEKVPRHVPLPDRPIRSMLANPNYQVILALLLRPVKKDAGKRVSRAGFPVNTSSNNSGRSMSRPVQNPENRTLPRRGW